MAMHTELQIHKGAEELLGIITPLVLALLLGSAQHQPSTTIRRPTPPRTYNQVRATRCADDITLVA